MKTRNFSINWLILALIIGSAMNFNPYGWPDSSGYVYTRNLCGTLIYVLAWLGILIFSAKNKNQKMLKRSTIFWIVMIIDAIILNFAAKISDTLPFLLNLLFAILTGLLYLPFYGLKFINNSDSFVLLLMGLFSLCMFISSVLLFLIKRPSEV